MRKAPFGAPFCLRPSIFVLHPTPFRSQRTNRNRENRHTPDPDNWFIPSSTPPALLKQRSQPFPPQAKIILGDRMTRWKLVVRNLCTHVSQTSCQAGPIARRSPLVVMAVEDEDWCPRKARAWIGGERGQRPEKNGSRETPGIEHEQCSRHDCTVRKANGNRRFGEAIIYAELGHVVGEPTGTGKEVALIDGSILEPAKECKATFPRHAAPNRDRHRGWCKLAGERHHVLLRPARAMKHQQRGVIQPFGP